MSYDNDVFTKHFQIVLLSLCFDAVSQSFLLLAVSRWCSSLADIVPPCTSNAYHCSRQSFKLSELGRNVKDKLFSTRWSNWIFNVFEYRSDSKKCTVFKSNTNIAYVIVFDEYSKPLVTSREWHTHRVNEDVFPAKVTVAVPGSSRTWLDC